MQDEEEYRVRRRRAKEFAGLLKEGVWGLWSKARFGEESREVRTTDCRSLYGVCSWLSFAEGGRVEPTALDTPKSSSADNRTSRTWS